MYIPTSYQIPKQQWKQIDDHLVKEHAKDMEMQGKVDQYRKSIEWLKNRNAGEEYVLGNNEIDVEYKEPTSFKKMIRHDDEEKEK